MLLPWDRFPLSPLSSLFLLFAISPSLLSLSKSTFLLSKQTYCTVWWAHRKAPTTPASDRFLPGATYHNLCSSAIQFKQTIGTVHDGVCERLLKASWCLVVRIRANQGANWSVLTRVLIHLKNKSLSFKGSVERSRHEGHFCSLLPYFLLSWLQIFQLCLSFWTSSFDLVLL